MKVGGFMIVVESDCCDCDLPCIGTACKYYQITRYLCDKCQEETTLYEFDGRQLCVDCLCNELVIVEGSAY